MNVQSTPNENIEQLDAAFITKMWSQVNSSLDTINGSSFQTKNISFTPLVLSEELSSSPALSASAAPAGLLDGLTEEYSYQKDLTGPIDFEKLDISKGANFLASFRICDYARTGAESYCAVDIIVYKDSKGEPQAVPVVKKAVVAGSIIPDGLKIATQKRADKISEMGKMGIPTIHIHGVDAESGIIYERLYSNKTKQLLEDMKSNEELAEAYLPQLVKIARKLDDLGFSSINFLRDIIFDGENFLFLDGGADVGTQGESIHSQASFDLLLEKFPLHADLIKRLYKDEVLVEKARGDFNSQVEVSLNL